MEIRYLKKLVENPFKKPNDSKFKWKIKPIPMEEILELEEIYNEGKPFPQSLRELLYLAGDHCYCLENNVEPFDNPIQKATQLSGRRDLQAMGIVMNRPFYVIDLVYPGNLRLVYLDEGDDPLVYHTEEDNNSLGTFGQTLSQLIEHVIRYKHGL